MIEATRRQALGAGPHDPAPVPPRAVAADPGADAYARRPVTRNPTAAELPAVAATQPASARPVDASLELAEATTAFEAEGDPIDLERAFAIAIERSRAYRDAKEDLFLAAIDLLAERHLWGPRWFQRVAATASGTPEPGDYRHAVTLLQELGVTQRLPWGGEVSARALVQYVDELRGGDDRQSADVLLGLSAPLLRGAGRVAREDLIQAERDLVYAARTFELFRREFLVDIASDYFDLLQQRAVIGNQQRQVENLEWLTERIEALADAGREPFFEVQRSQQQVLFAQNNLRNLLDDYQSRLDAFKITLGLPTTAEIRIAAADLAIPEPALDPIEAVRLATRLRLDLQTLADRVEDAERGVAVARNAVLPGLDVTASASAPTDSARDRPGLALDPSEGSYRLGLEFEAPLDRRIEKLGVRRAETTLARSRRAYDLAVDRRAQAVRRVIREIRQARFALRLQERNIEIAQTRLRGVLLRLRSLGPRDFIEAQEDLLEARNRRDAAERDLRVSILRYLLETGQMRVASDGGWLAPARLAPYAVDPEPSELEPDAEEPEARQPVSFAHPNLVR